MEWKENRDGQTEIVVLFGFVRFQFKSNAG
jgi:hypothetical protein